ncbi:MAG: indolepyruvate ferredoxin oxidoreductase family protein, partial [Nocardioidaceae bacterium]
RDHLVQNLGDGTFHHSGSLAIRAAVAANANITYKLLYNEAVAMTGGQRVQGALTVPALTRWLEVEGVRRVIVTTDDPKRYRGAELSGIAEVRHRRDLLAAQEELAQVAGVTALIHDQACAAEKRRLRKRGKLPEPAERVWINERVCEGCGDCGRKSGCLSVVPVETELGRKTQIHQASCNLDFSCLEGDCPSFVTVTPRSRPRRVAPDPPGGLPEPRRVVPAAASVRMTGIGGTGVVTMNQVLGTAALIDGMHVVGLDQTGLSQKAGPVVSDLHVSPTPLELSGKATAAGVDLLLGFDVLGAASTANLATVEPGRTVAVVSTSAVPTGRMVLDVDERFPELDGPLEAIDRVTRRELGVRVDAEALSERLFGDHMPANTILLGAAFQRGALPVSAEALEEAIRLNGAAVETNLRAFAWGRAVVAAPAAVEAAMRPSGVGERRPDPSSRERALIDRAAPTAGELRRIVELRVPELVAYGGHRYARRYSDAVERARVAEEERAPGRTALAEAVARQLFKLMAYKDEYEVARLHLDAVERARREGEFGADARVRFHLHPPLLRELGLRRKLALGAWFTPAFGALHRMRRLRGTPLDPFGHTEVRRTERALVSEYEALVDEALGALAPETHAVAVELAELPDVVRGYEELKLRNVALFRQRAESLRRRLARTAAGVPAAA